MSQASDSLEAVAKTRLLLVEDDDGDAFLVTELLQDARGVLGPVEVTWVRRVSEAVVELQARRFDCVLLDLGLPDSVGLSGLADLRAVDPDVAQVVLTGLDDAHQGVAAIAAGAEDYLVKDKVDGELLARSLRYAIGRAEADSAERQLREARLRASENRRLERGLLPRPLLYTSQLLVDVHYRPGRRRALLGGDFYDLVQSGDGVVHAIIGDVSGHGADEAALGVCLRVAWRTLVLAGATSDEQLAGVERILLAERPTDEIFATAALVTIHAETGTVELRLAGHPPPVVRTTAEGVSILEVSETGAALGIMPGAGWPAHRVRLAPLWQLIFFTDGLIEGHVPDGGRLGDEGLLTLLSAGDWPAEGGAALDAVVDSVETLNGGPLSDDVAMMRIEDRGIDQRGYEHRDLAHRRMAGGTGA